MSYLKSTLIAAFALLAVISTPAAADMDWSGPYAGLLLSYNDGDYGNGTNFPGDGEGNIEGVGYGLLLGYNFQNGKWVYGGELTFSGLNVDGAESCVNPTFACGVDVERAMTLSGRIGYTVGPKTLVYGTAGFAKADVYAYTNGPIGINGQTQSLDGYVFGIGVEHAFSDRFSLRGAILRHNFDDENFQTDVLYTNIDADYTTIEIGAVFHF